MPADAPGSEEAIELTGFLDGLFHGPAAHLANRFSIEPGAVTGICCADLLDPSSMSRILETYAQAQFPGDDRRAAASFWAQWYLGLLIPPLIILAVTSQTELAASPADLRVILDKNGQPERFILTRTVANSVSEAETAFARFAEFTDKHLSPLVFSLSARSGVSAKVYWMSAAVILDYTVDMFLPKDAVDLKQVTMERLLPNGQRNPLFGPYRPSGSEATRTRRVCCMRYGLSGVERCPDCPLKPTTGQKKRQVLLGQE